MSLEITENAGPCGKFRFVVEPSIKVGVITLQRKRPWPSCPNPETGNEWSHDMKENIVKVLQNTKFEVVYAPQNIQAVDDPSLRQVLDTMSHKVDVIVAIQPVISDGRLAPVLAQQWNNPLVLWATPEEQTGEMISGNSLVGTHLMSATLRQLGFKIELVYANLDWQLAEVQLLKGVHVSFAYSFLSKSKLGLVGYHAPGFQDFHPDPFCMRKTFGTLMLHLGLHEYEQTSVSEEDVAKDVEIMKGQKWPLTGEAMVEDLPLSAKHYLALKSLIKEYNLDGIAVRCWPELPNSKEFDGGAWCYLALARLASEGFPIACEGDVDGTLGCLIGKLLGCGVVYLSDWLEHDHSTLTLWHGGMAPTQLCEAVGSLIGPCISRHFNNKKAGCLDATIKIGIPVTIYRFWIMNGSYHVIILEGNTVKPKRHLLGNNGLVEFPADKINLTTKFEKWVQHGFPHHVCVVAGHHGKAFESLANHCNVTIVDSVLVDKK